MPSIIGVVQSSSGRLAVGLSCEGVGYLECKSEVLLDYVRNSAIMYCA